MFTKAETNRRLRQLKKLARKADFGISQNATTEIGTRRFPVAVDDPASYEMPEGDDLMDYWNINDTTRFMPDEIRNEGAVVHLYFSNNDPVWGQDLYTVITAWIGTDDRQPELIHVP